MAPLRVGLPFGYGESVNDDSETPETICLEVGSSKMTDGNRDFTSDDSEALSELGQTTATQVTYLPLKSAKARLRHIWDRSDSFQASVANAEYTVCEDHPLAIRPPRTRNRISLQEKSVEDAGRRPRYSIGLTDQFEKAVEKVDNLTRGRIMRVLGELSKDPDTPRGDTVKPLTGDMKGLWRRRIGNYRLVYQPDREHQRITLVDFDDRGSVYD